MKEQERTPIDLAQDSACLSQAGRARRDSLREELIAVVALRGRRRRRLQVGLAGMTLALTAGISGLLGSFFTQLSSDHDEPRTALQLVQRIPLRSRPRIKRIQTSPGVAARLTLKAASQRSIVLSSSLSDAEFSSWLEAAGQRPARMRINGRVDVFDLTDDSSED